MSNATKSATTLVTSQGNWQFTRASSSVVLVEHWPARPGKRTGWARGSSLSTQAAKRLYKTLLQQAL